MSSKGGYGGRFRQKGSQENDGTSRRSNLSQKHTSEKSSRPSDMNKKTRGDMSNPKTSQKAPKRSHDSNAPRKFDDPKDPKNQKKSFLKRGASSAKIALVIPKPTVRAASCAVDLPRLKDGQRTMGSVQQGLFKYYAYDLTRNADITISVFTISGDPDLYVSSPKLNEKPTLQSYSWRSAYVGGDTVTIFSTDPEFKKGAFVVGIYGQADASFRIVVSESSAENTHVYALKDLCLTVIEKYWKKRHIQETLVTANEAAVQLIFEHLLDRGKLSLAHFTKLNTCRLAEIRMKGHEEVMFEWLDTVSANTNVRVLDLANCQYVGDKALACVKKFQTTQLQELVLAGCERISAATIQDALAKHKGTLQILNLSEIKKVGDKALNGLATLKGLTDLSLASCDGVTDSGIQTLRKLKVLKKLNLAFSGVAGGGLHALSGLTDLEVLDLSNVIVTQVDAVLKSLGQLPHLNSLNVGHTRVGDNQAPTLGKIATLQSLSLCNTACGNAALEKGIQHLENLTDLDLSRTRVSNCELLGGLTKLESLVLQQVFPIITEQRLENTTRVDSAESIEAITNLVNLKTLNLANTMCSNDAVMQLKILTKLRDLDISRVMIEDDGMAAILRSMLDLTRLCCLNLNVTSASMAFLAQLTALRSFKLSHTAVPNDEPDDCALLLKNVPSITDLELLDARITDVAVETFPQLFNLRHLKLNRTRVTDALLAKLKRALPALVGDNLELVGQSVWETKKADIIMKAQAVEAFMDAGSEKSLADQKASRDTQAATNAVKQKLMKSTSSKSSLESGPTTSDIKSTSKGKEPAKKQTLKKPPPGSKSAKSPRKKRRRVHVSRLQFKKPVTATVDARKWKYYSAYIGVPSDIAVSVIPYEGDPDLYIKVADKGGTLPNKEHYTWASAGEGGETITIYHTDPKFKLGTMIFGITTGDDDNSNFCIQHAVTPVRLPTLKEQALILCEQMLRARQEKLDREKEEKEEGEEPKKPEKAKPTDLDISTVIGEGVWEKINDPSVVSSLLKEMIERKTLTKPFICAVMNKEAQLGKLNLNDCQGVSDEWLDCIDETQDTLTEVHLNGCYHLSDKAIAGLLWDEVHTVEAVGCSNLSLYSLEGLQGLTDTLTHLDLTRCVGVTDENFATIAEITSLKFLSVAYCGLMGGFLGDISSLVNLEELDLSCSIVAGRARRIKALSKLKQLRRLTLHNNRGVDNESVFCLKNMKLLKYLRLSETDVGGQGLAYLKGFTNLEALDLTKCQISDSSLTYVTPMISLNSLKLKNTFISDNGCASIAELQFLTELDVSHTKVGDAGLLQLTTLVDLKSVDLSLTSVADLGVKALCSTARGLESLHLFQTSVADDGMKVISEMKHLRELSVSHTSSDPELPDRCVSMVLQNSYLTSLGLLDSRITAAGAAHVTSLVDLERLTLSRVRVSDAVVSKIRRSLPRLRDIDMVGRVGFEARRSYYWNKVAKAIHFIVRTTHTALRKNPSAMNLSSPASSPEEKTDKMTDVPPLIQLKVKESASTSSLPSVPLRSGELKVKKDSAAEQMLTPRSAAMRMALEKQDGKQNQPSPGISPSSSLTSTMQPSPRNQQPRSLAPITKTTEPREPVLKSVQSDLGAPSLRSSAEPPSMPKVQTEQTLQAPKPPEGSRPLNASPRQTRPLGRGGRGIPGLKHKGADRFAGGSRFGKKARERKEAEQSKDPS